MRDKRTFLGSSESDDPAGIPPSQPAASGSSVGWSNTPAPAPAPEAARPARRGYSWILLTLIALQAGVIVWLVIDRNEIKKDNVMVVAERNTAVQTRDEVQQEYDAALARLDDLVSRNTTLNGEIKNKDGEITKLRSQIDAIMGDKTASAAKLAEANGLIEKLNSRVRKYEDRVAELEGANKRLAAEKTAVVAQRDEARDDAAQLREVGSVLHASNIRMIPIDLRRGGDKEVTTAKARRVDVLRIYLDIDENRIAESGTKELLLRILSPDGTLLSNAAYGSGVTTTAAGENLGYTLSRQILLTKNESVTDVTIDWKQDSDYRKGNYAIEVYHDGYRIGSGGVTLK